MIRALSAPSTGAPAAALDAEIICLRETLRRADAAFAEFVANLALQRAAARSMNSLAPDSIIRLTTAG